MSRKHATTTMTKGYATMHLAMNYSPQAADLLHNGSITIDRFKCPNWPDTIATAQEILPIYVHFPLSTGNGSIDSADWQQINEVMEQTGTPCVNVHLLATPESMPDIPLDTTRPEHQDVVAERLIAGVGRLVEQFGAERVIAENVPYDPVQRNTLRPASEPAVIRRVLEQTGCGLLLDVSHARIAARCLAIDPYEYLASLPVDRLREMHITGTSMIRGRFHDHMPFTDDDWQAAEWVFERIASGEWAKPWVATLEYGGVGGVFAERSDADVMAQQVPRLYELVQRANR